MFVYIHRSDVDGSCAFLKGFSKTLLDSQVPLCQPSVCQEWGVVLLAKVLCQDQYCRGIQDVDLSVPNNPNADQAKQCVFLSIVRTF